MLQILKKDGADGYEKILNDLGLDKNPNVRISEAVDGEKVTGFGMYELSPEQITVYMISYNDDLILGDGILRSVLFLAAMKGIEKAVFENGSEALPKRLKLIKDGNVLEPVSEIFGGCESCKSK